MQIERHASAAAAASAAARQLADSLSASEVVALPTGRTAELLYRAVIDIHARERRRFAGARVFNLDELAGVSSTDAASFAAFLRHHLFSHVDIPGDRIRLLDGRARPWQAEAVAHEVAIDDAGGLDLALVGIGLNGHIAFNEPAPSLPMWTHRVRLTAATRRAYSWVFRGSARRRRVPTHALTMGMGTIMRATRVLLLATGSAKARIVARAFEGPLTTRVPASLLQLHPQATIVLDREAASEFGRRYDSA